jgi:protein-tyrosine-phosphatase
MKEIGYDLSAHDSKSLEEVKGFAPFDAVVTMGCGDACPWMPAKRFVNWTITDPKVCGWRRRGGGREGGGGEGGRRGRRRSEM